MKGILHEAVQSSLQYPNQTCNQGQPCEVAWFSGVLGAQSLPLMVGQKATMWSLFLWFLESASCVSGGGQSVRVRGL